MTLLEGSLTNEYWAKMSSFAGIEIRGPDAADFLQRLSTQKISEIRTGANAPAAFLTSTGTVLAVFQIFRFIDRMQLIMHGDYLEAAMGFLDKFHFGENIRFEKIEVPVVMFLSHEMRIFLSDGADLPLSKRISEKEMIALRAWYGMPTTKAEIGEGNIILEGPMDEYVHPNKGCYPGQEVVERIRTYGNVAKKIVRVNFAGPVNENCVGRDLIVHSSAAGRISSYYELDGNHFGLATVKRLSATPGAQFQISNSETGFAEIPPAVAALPF